MHGAIRMSDRDCQGMDLLSEHKFHVKPMKCLQECLHTKFIFKAQCCLASACIGNNCKSKTLGFRGDQTPCVSAFGLPGEPLQSNCF